MADHADVEKNAATESLKHCFSNLVVAIQDPVLAASELYSVNLVSLPVVEKMSLLGLTRSEKNSQFIYCLQFTANWRRIHQGLRDLFMYSTPN